MAGQEAKIEVFNAHFSDLVTAIQSCTLDVTNQCLSRKLITTATQKKILNCSTLTPEEKATNLLLAVRECMNHQRKGFDKFLEILEVQQIFGDLIARLKEALERKVTAECTDTERVSDKQILPKQALRLRRKLTPDSQSFIRARTGKATNTGNMMEIRRSVVKAYLPQLKSSVQGVIASVASTSRTKKLISMEVYQRVMKNNQSKQPKRTDYLLHQICTSVKKSSKEFDLFLEVLDKHPSCRDVVLCIKQDITATKEGRLSKTAVSQMENHTLQRRHVEEVDRPLPDESGQVDKSKMVTGSGVTSDVRTNATEVSVQNESEYQWRMDRKQNEVIVHQQNATINEQDKQLESLSQEIARLKDEIVRKDLESSTLRDNQDNLQTAMAYMKVRVSFLEKEKHKPDSLLEAKVTELEGKINELNKEKGDLQEQLKNLEGKYHALDVSHQDTLATLKDTQTTLKDTQSTLKDTQTTMTANQTTMTANQTTMTANQTTMTANQTTMKDTQTTMNKLIFVLLIFLLIFLVALFVYFSFFVQ